MKSSLFNQNMKENNESFFLTFMNILFYICM
jgi:hypothetical protein